MSWYATPKEESCQHVLHFSKPIRLTFDVPLLAITGKELRANCRDCWHGIDLKDDGCESQEQEGEEGSHLDETQK